MFPANLMATSKKDIFILNNDPLALGFATGALNYYSLDFNSANAPASIAVSNSYREGVCEIPFDFDIISYDIANANGTLFVSILDGNGAGMAFFPL